MNFIVPLAILGLFCASSSSFRLDSPEEKINDDRIVEGKTAKPNQFPYMASLRGRGRGNIWQHMCGGSILNNRWVISAAHCTQGSNSNPSGVAIVVGAHHTQNDGQIYRLDRIVNHPAYNTGSFSNDICLLQTTNIIQYNKFVQPIPLRREFVDGDVASIVSGWGRLRFQGSLPTHLQYVEVNTLTNEDCRRRHERPRADRILEGTLCAFTREGQGICHGDSGGPLAANGKLIGLANWVKPCATGVPDAYLRISVYLNWIREVSGAVAL